MAGHQGAILHASRQLQGPQQRHTGTCLCVQVVFPPFLLSLLFSFTLLRESFLEGNALKAAALSRLPVTQHLLDQIKSYSQYHWKGK